MGIRLGTYEKAAAGIVLLSVLIGIVLYPSMPDMMASHWNAAGQVDGYMPRFWGLFLMPIISAVLLGLFVMIPKIDPLAKNIRKFRKQFDMFVLLLMLFMIYIYLLTIGWNFGVRFGMGQALSPALALLFYYAGVMMEESKRNWFIGVRTPWTMSSDRVWNETNRMGGKLMRAAGVIALLGVVFPDLAFVLILAPALAFAVFSVVYSYVLFRKGPKRRR
ncbi:Uncharacterised protein [uncultured archaeon]|nr:Uncharacterised protein [uncultured archaeon]